MNLKARRGAVIVMLGIMIVTLVSISAISIDFSRLWSLRNELQTSADAAAHAGAIQLLPPNNAGTTVAVATSYANVNLAMQGTVTVDSVELGDWDDIGKTFTPAAPHTDAVRVVVSRQSSGLIMSILGVLPPRLKARAIGWADAPVNNAAGCIKPIAVPFTQLMWRINIHRGIPNTPDNSGMYRPFEPDSDLVALSNMTAAERTFSLKIGTSQVNDTLGSMGGNYQGVQLGPLMDADSVPYSPAPVNGVNAFKDNMSGGTCHTLKVGDILETQPGLGDGQPAICGAWPGAQGCGNSISGPGICSVIRGDQNDPLSIAQSDSTFGNCEEDAISRKVGVDIKAAFYRCMVGCNGLTRVEVTLLGSFTLTKVFPDNAKQSLNPYTNFSKAEIVGIFEPMSDAGTVGPGSTTLVTPIIVR